MLKVPNELKGVVAVPELVFEACMGLLAPNIPVCAVLALFAVLEPKIEVLVAVFPNPELEVAKIPIDPAGFAAA